MTFTRNLSIGADYKACRPEAVRPAGPAADVEVASIIFRTFVSGGIWFQAADPRVRHKAEMERMLAVIAEVTAENLEWKKRSEVGRFIWGVGGDQIGRDTAGRQDEAPFWVADIPHARGARRSPQRVLRLEAARHPQKTERANLAGSTRCCPGSVLRSASSHCVTQKSAIGSSRG